MLLGSRSRAVILFTAWFAATTPSASAVENWNQFRGPHGDGVAADAELPLQWDAENHVAWKIEIPGAGWSQPIVWGDKIFVTAAVAENQAKPDPKNNGPGISGFGEFLATGGGTSFKPPEEQYHWLVRCLDAASGKTLWEKVAREGRPTTHIHPNNTYATETPVTDGERLIAYFGMTGIYCYDLAGKLLWSKEAEAFPTQFGWGPASSPVIHGDLLYIQCDNDKASFLAAHDKRTGDQRWRVERDELSNWSTPYIWKNKLRTELVTAGGNRMRSYDPETGKLLWELTGNGRTSITPVGDNELLYVDSFDRLTGGYGQMAAIRPGASGDISAEVRAAPSDHVAWATRLSGFRNASPVMYNGLLFVLEQEGGIVRCIDAATGKDKFRKRIPGAKGFTASPIVCDGRVYCIDQRGRTAVIEASPDLKVLAENDLDEMTWSSPAAAGNHLLIRTRDHLYNLGD